MALTRLNVAVLAPIPIANNKMAASEKPALRDDER
jgi:hypothetical protein